MPATFSYANILHAIGQVLDQIGVKSIAIHEEEEGLFVEGFNSEGQLQVQMHYDIASLYDLLTRSQKQADEQRAYQLPACYSASWLIIIANSLEPHFKTSSASPSSKRTGDLSGSYNMRGRRLLLRGKDKMMRLWATCCRAIAFHNCAYSQSHDPDLAPSRLANIRREEVLLQTSDE